MYEDLVVPLLPPLPRVRIIYYFIQHNHWETHIYFVYFYDTNTVKFYSESFRYEPDETYFFYKVIETTINGNHLFFTFNLPPPSITEMTASVFFSPHALSVSPDNAAEILRLTNYY